MEPQDVLDELKDEDGRWDVFEQTLSEMTPIYHQDNEWLDIVRANISHAKPGGEEIGVQADLPAEMDPDVTGPDILRLLDDLAAHEVEHVNSSDLNAKQRFAEEYPNFGKLAGHVYNIFEDEYIDMRRKVRFYGMRSKLAYYVWLHMNTPSRAPPVDEVEESEGLPNALMAGLLQVALSGTMNADPSDEVKDAMARIEPLIEKVRAMARRDEENHRDGKATKQEREVLVHGAIQILLRYIPDPEDYDGDKMDERKRATGGDPREMNDESPDDMGDPRIEMSEEMKEQVEEMLEELAEDDETSDPMPEGADPEVVEVPDDVEIDLPDEPELEDAELPESEDAMDEPMPGDDMDGDAEGSGDGEREGDVDDETIDPLGDDAGGGSESEGGGDSTPGDGESEADFEGRDRDIEALIEEYGRDALKVTN